jgi:hypothetical protein
VNEHRIELNKPLRDQLAEDVRRFIESGGKVQRLREGEMSEAGMALLTGRTYARAGKKGKTASMK